MESTINISLNNVDIPNSNKMGLASFIEHTIKPILEENEFLRRELSRIKSSNLWSFYTRGGDEFIILANSKNEFIDALCNIRDVNTEYFINGEICDFINYISCNDSNFYDVDLTNVFNLLEPEDWNKKKREYLKTSFEYKISEEFVKYLIDQIEEDVSDGLDFVSVKYLLDNFENDVKIILNHSSRIYYKDLNYNDTKLTN